MDKNVLKELRNKTQASREVEKCSKINRIKNEDIGQELQVFNF